VSETDGKANHSANRDVEAALQELRGLHGAAEAEDGAPSTTAISRLASRVCRRHEIESEAQMNPVFMHVGAGIADR